MTFKIVEFIISKLLEEGWAIVNGKIFCYIFIFLDAVSLVLL